MTTAIQFDGLDLTYSIDRNTIRFNEAEREGVRSFECTLTLRGSDEDDLWDQFRTIQDKLRRAKRASGATPLGAKANMTVQPGTTYAVTLDVTGGDINFESFADRDRRVMKAHLRLWTLPYLYGDAIILSNLVLQSAAFDQSPWSLTRATVGDDLATAPDGSETADKLIEDGSNNTHFIRQQITTEASVEYEYSVYLKAAQRTAARLRIDDGTTLVEQTEINLSLGTIHSGSGTITALEDDWYRLALLATHSGTTTRVEIDLESAPGTTSYLGDGSSGLYLWGAQANKGATQGVYMQVGASRELTNGVDTLYLFGIPGDECAVARLTLSDTGTEPINAIHIGARSHDDLASDDFAPIQKFASASPGVDDTDGSSYINPAYSRIMATDAERLICSVAVATPKKTTGYMDCWPRIRDSSNVHSAPLNHQAALSGGLAANTFLGHDADTSSTTSVVALVAGATTDDLLILACKANSSTASVSSITSIGGASWALASDGVDTASLANSGDCQVRLYALKPVSTITAGTTVTVTWSSLQSRPAAVIYKLAGMAAASYVEQVSAGTASDAAASISTNSVTTTQAYQLLVGVAAHDSGDEPFSGASNSFTNVQMEGGLGLAFRTVTSAGTYSTTFSRPGSGTHDMVALLVSFKYASATAPSLTTGAGDMLVVALGSSGEVSPVSDLKSVTIANAYQTITQTWDEPSSGEPAGYRVYRKISNVWKYFDTGSTATTYTWTTESGITTGSPDFDGSPVGQFRLVVSLLSGETIFESLPFSSSLANGFWQDVFAATLPVPPIPVLDDADADGFLFQLYGWHETSFPYLDADIITMVPADEPQMFAEWPTYDLATNRDWLLDQRRDGRVSGRLYETGTTTDAGQPSVVGALEVGPGNALIVPRLLIEDGVSDVTNTQFIPTVRLAPRWRWFRGSR